MAFWRSFRYVPITSRTRASSTVPEKSLAVRRSWRRVLSMRTTSAVAVSLALMAWVSRSLSSCSRLMRGRAGHSHCGRRLHHPPHPERGDDDHDPRHDGEYAQGGNVGEHAHQGMRDEEDAEDDLGQPQQ